MDRARMLRLAKAMVEMGKEMQLVLKSNPELLVQPVSRDSIVAKGPKNARLYIEAQDLIKLWRFNWAKIYKTDPYIEKGWVYPTANLLKRFSYTELNSAMRTYFETEDKFIENQRYPYPYFIKNINKYLAEGTIGHEDIGQMVQTTNGNPGTVSQEIGNHSGQRGLRRKFGNDRVDDEDKTQQLDG